MGKKLTFIDLFAGIGGMRLAYEKAGAKCVYSNEWNKYSQIQIAIMCQQNGVEIPKITLSSIQYQ